MSSPERTAVQFESALDQLEELRPDEYIIAFGPNGEQFCGTPNGYSATSLPGIVLDLFYGASRVVWASFGSNRDSWFFTCEAKNGNRAFYCGDGIPAALLQFLRQLNVSQAVNSSLRVQLGGSESFVVWVGTTWACHNVPGLLRVKLCEMSSASHEWNGVTRGSLMSGTLNNVQWHHSGVYYIKSGNRHIWDFQTDIFRAGWYLLWNEPASGKLELEVKNDLAYTAIDPHAPTGETFVFIKKQEGRKEAPFLMHFEHERRLHTNLGSKDCAPKPIMSVQHMPKKSDIHYQWAVSKKSGRPHPRESRELFLDKGDRLKVLKDMGRDWYIVSSKKGTKGWVHGSWLDFGDRKLHADPKSAYNQFREDLQKLLVPGQLCKFPAMASYIDACTRVECQLLKEDVGSVGICLHDLMVLLEGSGRYSYELLKEERNVWHPDRFVRFCHADHVDRLKPMAEEMFVLYGILMDRCKA
ncbi:hypothetical protein N0V83_003290 [Neocucurbitaria cava]|uniref:SH3b domain-containing protein n=1 Tax=Neocucurbitaria cava TaxID=798079 RepID=A0A9W8YBE3_9PLEO|nr:hypothetical protein N0V83_003290 [Neocucurbitaria cava]